MKKNKYYKQYKMKREIYSVSFNRSFTEKGEVRMICYTLGVPSQNGYRVPTCITQYNGFVLVEFTDQSRHYIPLGNNVELFDRVIEPK